MIRVNANDAVANQVGNNDAVFRDLADRWWMPDGPFGQLHRMNPPRIGFIHDAYDSMDTGLLPLNRARVLDIGCGGGLAAEAMARLGCRVTGIDTSPEAIEVAKSHAVQSELTIDYTVATSSDLCDSTEQFDIVTLLETIEHVSDVEPLLADCYQLVRPGGMLVVSTLNRTLKSYLGAIVAAEKLFRWVPEGTHDWRMFFRPNDLRLKLIEAGFTFDRISGLVYNPLTMQWRLSEDTGINYIVAVHRGYSTA